MLPFHLVFKPGVSVHDQVVFAVKRACVTGRLEPGERFPSVRALSQELRINPNTAHKAVATLVGEGLLEVRPGTGTIVARAPAATKSQGRAALREDIDHLVVEARTLSMSVDEVVDAVRDQWRQLDRRTKVEERTR